MGVDPRLRVAVDASLAWYQDVFQAHGIPTEVEEGLWRAKTQPPRWHSAAKTLRTTVSEALVERAVESFDRCSVADSFGTLDLTSAGFDVLFRATWLHHPAVPREGTLPPEWSTVHEEDQLALWNEGHDTVGVLPPSLVRHPRFTFLARHVGGDLVGGAVLHDSGPVVELSNVWSRSPAVTEADAVLACVRAERPGRAVVCYERTGLDDMVAAGFSPVGVQVGWAR